MKKAISAATSAALLASLLATAAVPTALANQSVSGTVSVPVGGTSSGTTLALTFNDSSTHVNGLTGAGFCTVTAGGTRTATLKYQLKDAAGNSTLSFVGTPTFAPGIPLSLGASVALSQTVVANDSFTVTITGCDPNNVEQFTVTGLQIAATSSAATGTIQGITTPTPTDYGFVSAITGTTTTATGTLQAAIIGSGAQTVSVNVTSTCPFAIGPSGVNTTANFSDISDARSITFVAPPVGNIQQVTFGTGVYGHAISSTVTQTVAACGSISSPGTVGSVATQNAALQAATQQQVNPGQQNQLAGTTTITEPSAGFLAAASVLTFKISAPGVLFSNPPTATVTGTTALVAPTGLTATAVVPGTHAAGTYYYVVTALVGTGETTRSAEASATLSGAGGVSVTWAAVAGATSYRVYEGTTAATETQYYTVTAPLTSFSDTGAAGTAGTPAPTNVAFISAPTAFIGTVNATGGTMGAGTRYYLVQAVTALGHTNNSAVATATITSGALNSVVLSWTPVAGATGYVVYKSIDGGTSYGNISSATTPITTASFTDTAIVLGSTLPIDTNSAAIPAPLGILATGTANAGTLAAATYYYEVTATNAAGATLPSTPASAILAATGSVSLTWTAVAGATGYNVYGRPATSGGTYGLLASVITNSYIDAGTPATPGAVPPTSSSTTGTAMTLTSSLCALSFDRTSCTVTVNAASVGALSSITLGNAVAPYTGAIYLDVASTVPYGTAVNLNVTESPAVTTSVSSSTIAYVAQGLLAVSVQAVPTVYIDNNAQQSGVITVSESMPGFFQAGSSGNNQLTVCITDQGLPMGAQSTFTFAPYAIVTAGNVSLLNTSTYVGTTSAQGTLTNNATCATWYVFSASTTASTITIVGANASGALSATVPTNGPTLSVMSNALVGPVVMTVSSGTTSTTLYSKQVTNAVRAFKSGVNVTAVTQPYVAPGTTSAAGDVKIAETLNGQLLAGEQITCTVLPNPLNDNQQTYLSTANANNLPVVTTGGGLLAYLVGTTSTSFTVGVTQQAYAPSFGSINVGNLWFTTISGATNGPVTLECMNGTQYTGSTFHAGTIGALTDNTTGTSDTTTGTLVSSGYHPCFDIVGSTPFVAGVATIDAGSTNAESVTLVTNSSCTAAALHQQFAVFLGSSHAVGAPIIETIGTGSPFMTGAAFDQFVSNAIVGTAPAVTANAITASGTALGATKVGPFTITPTKLAKPGQYVTWKFSTGPALVGKSVQIWVATKNSAGKWSAFKLLTARRVDTSGNAYFWWKTSSKAWISVRAGYLTTLSVATQARWL
jgi:hypothetical protein